MIHCALSQLIVIDENSRRENRYFLLNLGSLACLLFNLSAPQVKSQLLFSPAVQAMYYSSLFGVTFGYFAVRTLWQMKEVRILGLIPAGLHMLFVVGIFVRIVDAYKNS